MLAQSASVELSSGRIQGRDGAYLGIPYAAPPVGERRWAPPTPVASWTGDLETLTPGPPPPQPESLRQFMNHRPQIEIAIADMNREDPVRTEFAQIDLNSLPGQQMHRYRVARERIDDQNVKFLQVAISYFAFHR